MELQDLFVLALFENKVLDSASQMFNDNFEYNGRKDRMPINLFDTDFRLYKPNDEFVNFEVLISSDLGRYVQPIGFFDKNLDRFLLNEFVNPYNALYSSGKISQGIRLLDLEFNAIIAAFSMITLENSVKIFIDFDKYGWKSEFNLELGIEISPTHRYDKRFESNGLISDFLFCFEGYPQFYLDDKYKIDGPIAAYILEQGEIKIYPMKKYKEKYDIMRRMELLPVYKRV